MKTNVKKNILLTGAPGAGKGTQAAILARKYDWYTFSIGQILRNTKDPELLRMINKGAILHDRRIGEIVVNEIENHKGKVVVVDGFPRELSQMKDFEDIASKGKMPAFVVVALTVSEDESWRRLRSRGRPDDDRQAWETRWEKFYSETLPAIEYCRQYNRLIEINGNESIESVAGAIEAGLTQAGILLRAA